MKATARDRLVHLLAGDAPAQADVAMLTMPSDALSLHVADVGPVTLPIRAAHAKRLIKVARPAMFGRGEETLRDATIRDTWELTPDQVRLGGADWDAHLAAALAHFRDELGLPATAELRAELHALLVYGKGQFFLSHQDSEKTDTMVATLVVSLPSVHTGGELVVDDGGTERTFHGSRDDLVLVAFYADRRHEVKPVRSGYRVTLTFNLLLSGPTQPAAAGPVEQAARHLTEHFTTKATRRYGGDDLGEPRRLAFLLDHEYTQAGLKAQRFKGADAQRVALLRQAAEQARCEVVFALAEIKETWDAQPAGEPWLYGDDYYDDEYDDGDESGDAGGRYPGDDADDVFDADDYELNELIDHEIRLSWWVGADGSGEESIALYLGDHEVCTATPSESLTPYASEYEGYMGNWGNTIDRWYRRAAVLVWPQQRAFAARAEAGSAWALETLLDRIESGDLAGARADALSLAPFWRQVEADRLPLALEVAAGLRDPSPARVVLGPFRLEMLTAEHAAGLAVLVREYGERWVDELVDHWDAMRQPVGTERTDWVSDALLPLCQTLRKNDADALADHIGDRIWGWLSNRIRDGLRETHPTRRGTVLAALGQPLARLLEAVTDDEGGRITAALQTQDDNVTELLMATLRAQRPPARAAFAALAGDVSGRLQRLLDAPSRDDDDWSITWTGCGCDLCQRLGAFLASPSERTLEWPLAKRGRQHLHQRIEIAGLSVRHTTRRQGRPFTLVLAKTPALFERERQKRQQAQRDVDWVAARVQLRRT